jgi:hypothetical protein
LPFSCRERWECLSKANDLAREAVGCNGGLGGNSGIKYRTLQICISGGTIIPALVRIFPIAQIAEHGHGSHRHDPEEQPPDIGKGEQIITF